MTAATFTACVVVYYAAQGGSWYGPGQLPNGSQNWHAPIVAMVSHINDEHLWQNMLMLAMLVKTLG